MQERGRKKIAFVIDEAIVGGIETAFIQMIKKIDAESYDIHLFTNFHGNPCIAHIPKCIKVHNLDNNNLRTQFLRALRRGSLFRAAYLMYCYLRLRISKTMLEELRWSLGAFTLSEELFDCVIAYKTSWRNIFLAMEKLNSKKRIVWIHGEISGNHLLVSDMIEKITLAHKIFCVSADIKKYIEEICPMIKERTEVFYNLLDSEEIAAKSEEYIVPGETINLVTVGRLSSEKGQDMIPQTARLLIDAGYKFKWYIVGDGPLRETVEEKCRECDVTENVIFTGTMSNPYPYMKGCNIYVQTSYEEGWGLTVQEAKILHKPIVTTDLPVMREQIEHMKNGYITEGISPEVLFEGIKTLLDNPTLCEQFVNELKKKSHDNSQELEKLYAFIES